MLTTRRIQKEKNTFVGQNNRHILITNIMTIEKGYQVPGLKLGTSGDNAKEFSDTFTLLKCPILALHNEISTGIK
jgi:hypothetical protein